MTDDLDADDDLVYLTFADALEVHAAIFGVSVEQGADRLRSRDVLEGALGRPAQYAHYQDADLALQAAVLAHGIAETQPFVDGNKRTGMIAMLTFLAVNDHDAAAPDPEVAGWMLSLSRGATADEIADLLRPLLQPST